MIWLMSMLVGTSDSWSSRSRTRSRSTTLSTTCSSRARTVWIIAVAHRFDQQTAQRRFLEQLAQHIENLAVQRAALDFQLLQQALIDVAFAGFVRHQIPQMADFGLADAVDAPKALLQSGGIPGEIIVDPQVGALEVDTFASSVGRSRMNTSGSLRKLRFDCVAFIALDAANLSAALEVFELVIHECLMEVPNGQNMSVQ